MATVVDRPLAQRAQRLVPSVVAVAFWIIVPLMSLVFVGVSADKIVRHVNDIPSGTRGAFYVTSHNCQRQVCITGGTFTSDDGRIVEQDLLGVYRWDLGSTHPVVYRTDAVDVIPLPDGWDPTSTVVGVTGAVFFLGVWGWCVVGLLRERRVGEPSPA